jgi:hypothetical protein
MAKLSNLIIRCALLALIANLAALSTAAQARSSRTATRSTAPVIPRGTQMKIRLQDTIDTKESRNGDRYTATVVSPSRYDGATITGHVSKINQSGKFKGRTSLVLAFDRIQFRDGSSRAMAAQVVRVYGEESAKRVDEEGTVQSGSKTSTTTKRTAGGAAAGAVIGAIAGGGKGAAIGAAIGAGVGAGSTYIQGSNKVKLESGTEILIKTTR